MTNRKQNKADEWVRRFFAATSAEEEDCCLYQLLCIDARLIGERIFSNKLSCSFNRYSEEELEDLCTRLKIKLFCRLYKLKQQGNANAIREFDKYVTTVARNVWNDWLREKYPQRKKLKSVLRYLLTHRAAFSLWEASKGWLGGFAVWKGQGNEIGADALESHRETLAKRTFGAVRDEKHLSPIVETFLHALFQETGQPVENERLVGFTADVLQIEEIIKAPLEDGLQLPSQHPQPLSQLVHRETLGCVWEAICKLLYRQRLAFLLGFKNKQGDADINQFIDTGTATREEIADAFEMTSAELDALWDHLPLLDEAIAPIIDARTNSCGTTAKQVSDLRKLARKHLRSHSNAAEIFNR